jgi:WD40 repeat protein
LIVLPHVLAFGGLKHAPAQCPASFPIAGPQCLLSTPFWLSTEPTCPHSVENAAGIDGKVRLFDPSSRNQVMAWPAVDPGVPFAACFLGSSKLLATLSADGYIKLWSTAVVRGPLAGLHVPLCTATAGPGNGLGLGEGPLGAPLQQGFGGFGPGGTRRTGGRPAAAMLQQQQLLWRPQLACNQAGTAFAASSLAGEVPLVFVSSGGEELRLETGAPGHTAAVPALDWHPDGGMPVLLTGSLDGSLVLSDLRQRDVTAA